MHESYINMRPISESYSRQLDERVQMQEMPYGYDMPPPPADTDDYNMRPLQSNIMYNPRDKNG